MYLKQYTPVDNQLLQRLGKYVSHFRSLTLDLNLSKESSNLKLVGLVKEKVFYSQPAFTWSKSVVEAQEQCLKFAQT